MRSNQPKVPVAGVQSGFKLTLTAIKMIAKENTDFEGVLPGF